MDSKIGLLIQLTGVMLITVLTIFLQRSLKSLALRYWVYAWLSLSFALICLRLAFDNGRHTESFYSLYFFGEYIFGLALVAGCRNLYKEIGHKRSSELLIIPLGIIAIALPLFSESFDEIYSIHCLVLSGFFAAAFFTLRKARIRSFGWRVMHIAVALLALDFFLFFSVFSTNHLVHTPIEILPFNSIVDLVLETALGFGMIIVLLEKLLVDVKTANEALADALDRLEELVNIDPLTAAFNRHAFYGFVRKGEGAEPVAGCVGFFDLDNLKEINDRFGHAAGDQAIRAVARSIRDLIRAEDLIYRWGGDEFFVIMIGMEAEMARLRMGDLEDRLADLRVDGFTDTFSVGVSSGFCNFDGASELEQSIKRADAEMYKRKELRKRMRPAGGFVSAIPQTPSHLVA
jgi:diguanylate cyclase (GGDEF)-like protein